MARTWVRRDQHRYGPAKRRSSCPTGKNRWATRDEALATVNGYVPNGAGKGVVSGVYACRECAGWHCTSRG